MNSEGLIEVGGHKLYAKISGKGKPPVVFDAGYGDFSRAWESVFSEVSTFTKALAYDRAGLGMSESGPHPKNSLAIIEDMKVLLKNLDIVEPIILVGHSFGGVNCLHFAYQNIEMVAGIILIDSTPDDYIARFLPEMPKSFQEAYMKQFTTEGTFEDLSFSLEQLKISKIKLNIPLVLLAAGKKKHYTEESQALWLDIQKEQLELSTKSKIIVAENSSHYIQHDEPQMVINTIRSVVEKIRAGYKEAGTCMIRQPIRHP